MDAHVTPPGTPVSVRFNAADPQRLSRALRDLRQGFAQRRLAGALAWLDLRNRYRGSVLGPFWLTLSTAVMLASLGLLYSTLFQMSLAEYLPWLAVSLILWNMLAQMVTEACTSLTSAESIVRQMPLPFTVHALRCVTRNALVAAHNLPLVVIVLLIFGVLPGWSGLLALPGLLLLAVNALSASLLLGMVCARFRDIAPIVGSVMQIAFFMTPVIWKPQLLSPEYHWLLLLNPFYTLLELVRGPLIEGGGNLAVWLTAIGYTVVHCAVGFAFFVRFRGRVAFWV
ncbi:ABC transporter permease [Teichococcus vastitatis]|jgi:lipopolysaccharide transport system permease protein|uniref:Transport permease protein n=1 Tax=Teichococcus vastitatis TaxID=2307076 RepID=A0ABS9WCD9_9PROT|nr:ABC transporter permease [Pseudoroseomonas vastitatis]MCI0756902.1 ABC transporter permease [Pseudoroseomonas vastitatis]